MEEYTVKLNDFEGPMELLLELIETQKLSISEISLSTVCDQFLEYTKHFEDLKPNYLANFLVIAARLILIKSKALLPFLEFTEEEEEGIDELKKRLEEFQKIKRGAAFIKKLEHKNHIFYERTSALKSIRVFLPPKEVSKETLHEILLNLKETFEEEVEPMEEEKIEAIVSFEETISGIRDRLAKVTEEYFHNVADGESKANTIIAFLAVLELAKQRFLFTEQEENFTSIKIKRAV